MVGAQARHLWSGPWRRGYAAVAHLVVWFTVSCRKPEPSKRAGTLGAPPSKPSKRGRSRGPSVKTVKIQSRYIRPSKRQRCWGPYPHRPCWGLKYIGQSAHQARAGRHDALPLVPLPRVRGHTCTRNRNRRARLYTVAATCICASHSHTRTLCSSTPRVGRAGRKKAASHEHDGVTLQGEVLSPIVSIATQTQTEQKH